MNLELHSYLAARTSEFETIPDQRREILEKIRAYVDRRRSAGNPARLVFICTHNSRRSHLAQAAAIAAAEFYERSGVESYSGGTEATAFFSRSVRALRSAGYVIYDGDPTAANPVYDLRTEANGFAHEFFSKRFNDAVNPTGEFAAVMTCSQADADCPFVPGAETRISLPYEDPKLFDDTPEAEAKYAERCAEIHREILYAFRR